MICYISPFDGLDWGFLIKSGQLMHQIHSNSATQAEVWHQAFLSVSGRFLQAHMVYAQMLSI